MVEQSRLRSETIAALPAAKLSEWEAQLEPLACDLIDRLPSDHLVDIVGEFAQLWSLSMAVIVTGARWGDAERLRDLARDVSSATADPSNSSLQSRAKAANTELARAFDKAPVSLGTPVFVALSQTLPAFLANAWLALLRHPAELEQLRAEPQLMPIAIEELLRYAGLARVLFRRATAPVDLGGIRIGENARVILMLASANRDPAQFPEPNRLDLRRRSGRALALGAGPHSCAGGPLIRMAVAIATRAFLKRFAGAPMTNPVQWQGGSGFRSAAALYVMLRCDL